MDQIIEIIDEIIQHGLNSNVAIEDKEIDLEKNLVRLYLKYFDIEYGFDKNEYANFKKPDPLIIRENVNSNFPEFGFYHVVLNGNEIHKDANYAVGDAIDDLTDIILDLLEIKWRKEHNSKEDALWYFKLIFKSHTQMHILGLLNFLKSKNG